MHRYMIRYGGCGTTYVNASSWELFLRTVLKQTGFRAPCNCHCSGLAESA